MYVIVFLYVLLEGILMCMMIYIRKTPHYLSPLSSVSLKAKWLILLKIKGMVSIQIFLSSLSSVSPLPNKSPKGCKWLRKGNQEHTDPLLQRQVGVSWSAMAAVFSRCCWENQLGPTMRNIMSLLIGPGSLKSHNVIEPPKLRAGIVGASNRRKTGGNYSIM